jgi:polyhydroxyalkanoate synthase
MLHVNQQILDFIKQNDNNVSLQKFLNSNLNFFKNFIDIAKQKIEFISSCDEIIETQELSRLKYFSCNRKNAGTVLIVPSIINKSDILDITQNRSFCVYLKQFHNVYLIDWLSPKSIHSDLGLDNYVAIINKYIATLASKHQKKISLIGYCLGGNLSIASTIHQSDHIDKLALIATPWDFNKMSYKPLLYAPPFSENGTIPAGFITALFNTINYEKILAKYLSFYENKMPETDLHLFLQVENWINNGIDLTHKAAKNIYADLFLKNNTFNGSWQVLQKHILLEKIFQPTIVFATYNDIIVPKDSSIAISDLMSNCKTVETSCGHIGIIISKNAQSQTWKTLSDWI